MLVLEYELVMFLIAFFFFFFWLLWSFTFEPVHVCCVRIIVLHHTVCSSLEATFTPSVSSPQLGEAQGERCGHEWTCSKSSVISRDMQGEKGPVLIFVLALLKAGAFDGLAPFTQRRRRFTHSHWVSSCQLCQGNRLKMCKVAGTNCQTVM